MRLAPLLSLLALAALPLGASAQDMPPYVPANPVLESRSALYAQPFLAAHPGWQFRLVSDYYNVVEVSRSPAPFTRQYLFDAEVMQADAWLTRDVSRRVFVIADLPVRGGYSGFLDQALIWYHHTTGLSVPARDELPRNEFQWGFVLPDSNISRPRPGTFIGDVRAGAGVRLGRAEIVGTVTLPSASVDGDGWTRHVVGTSLAVIGRLVGNSRVIVDASSSVGVTPAHGPLARYERTTFVSGMVSSRWRFAGPQAVFGTVWVQSSNWRDTGFHAIDAAEVTMDFGFLLRVKRSWPELQLGMTQDLKPDGPSMDVGFSIGLRW
jgi:hypothetical protein